MNRSLPDQRPPLPLDPQQMTEAVSGHTYQFSQVLMRALHLRAVSRLASAPVTVGPHQKRSLSVQITLGGEVYALRHQAKAAGYRWIEGAWQRDIVTNILGDSVAERLAAEGRLDESVRLDQVQWAAPSQVSAAQMTVGRS